MSRVDHAPVIAAYLVERAEVASYQVDPDLPGTIAARWPGADREQARRGLLIARELIDARIAELRVETVLRLEGR